MEESPLPAEITRFLEELKKAGSLWETATVNVVAVRVHSDWIALSGLVRLHVRGGARSEMRRATKQYESVMAVRDTIRADQLHVLLSAVSAGECTIRGQRIRFASWIREEVERAGHAKSEILNLDPPVHWFHQLNAQVAAASVAPPIVNAHLLTMNQAPRSRDLLRHVPGGLGALEDELRSRPNDISSMRQLMRRWDACLYDWTEDSNTSTNVVAPLGIAFDLTRTEFKGNTLRLSLVGASSIAVRATSIVAAWETRAGRPVKQEFRSNQLEWQPSEDLVVAEVDVHLLDTDSVEIFLRRGLTTIHAIELSRTTAATNLLQAAHALHHERSDSLWRALLTTARGSQATEFAAAVARLFTGLGLPTIHLAGEKHTDSADSMASLGTANVLLIESTTAAFDANKISKLIQRASQLRVGLRSRGWTIAERFVAPLLPVIRPWASGKLASPEARVVPVMVTAASAAEIAAADLESARRAGVAVLCREDLERLLVATDNERDPAAALAGLIEARLT